MSDVLTLSGVRRSLAELDLHPSRALGQNFLHDRNLATWIVGQLDSSRPDQIIEVGPGLGALTGLLVERGCRLTVIEKDPRLAEALLRRWPTLEGSLHVGDAAEFDPRPLFAYGPAQFIGNLPYRASAPIAFRFFSSHSPVQKGVIMVQEEFARRLTAAAGGKDYGIPTAILGRLWSMRAMRRVGPGVFFPRPEIDSTVVAIQPQEPDPARLCDEQTFDQLIHRGFSQRRKQLHNLLDLEPELWARFCDQRGLSLAVRAEGLRVDDWIALAAMVRPLREVPDEEELFDVVDEADRVVGRYPRSVVHVNNLRHRAVHVFLKDEKGDLILQKRSAWKDRHPGVWDSSASGHVNSGDTYLPTAYREVSEELGVDVSSLDHVAGLPASDATDQEFVQIYTGHTSAQIHPDPREVERVVAFPLELIKCWVKQRPQDFAPGFLECFHVIENAL